MGGRSGRARSVNVSLVRQMVLSLIPSEPVLAGAEAKQVEEDVIEFVLAQLASMPLYLWIPYSRALTAFDLLAVMRYGTFFRRLGHDKQRQYVTDWAGSWIAPMRDFVKLIRSCALLSYLDHPLVLDRLEQDASGAPDD